MNKKLFLVLVLVAAVLVAGSLVIAGKSVFKGPSGVVVEPQQPQLAPKIAQSRTVTTLPQPAAIQKKAALNETSGRPQKMLTTPNRLSGIPVRLGTPSGKDLCNLAGTPAYSIPGYLYGLEWYANYQDPTSTPPGCTDVWPFKVTEIDFQMIFNASWAGGPVLLQGFVFADVGTPSCPKPGVYPGDVICSTTVYSYDVPAGSGYYVFPIPMDTCCLYKPYFAAVYIGTNLYQAGIDSVNAVTESNPTALCRTYWSSGASTWYDLVYYGALPGPIMLSTQGYTHPQNNCYVPPADTCYVTSIVPATKTVLAGTAANYTVNVAFGGTVTSCNLTATPDPACPSCVTTMTPNPVVLPATSSAMTIQTDASTTPGTYTFSVNGTGSKTSATLIVVGPNDTCEVHRWVAGSGYRFDGWSAGDQNAVLMDPTTCIACGPNVYPFHIKQVKTRWVNPSAATALDVVFHVFEADTPYCSGPGAEIYHFPAHITAWSPNYVTVNLPKVICVHGPFWLSAEYVSVTPIGIVFPSLRMDIQTYADTCTQFNYYGGTWYEWDDFWSPPPPGYFFMSAIGNCQDDTCPITCNMQQDNGHAHSLVNWIWEGFEIADYYNPANYCTSPVYPYNISNVEFPLYDVGAVGLANVQIGVYLQGEDSCSGPGPQIYLSDPIAITSFYPTWSHIVLPRPVCVYEPFYIALIWNAGPTPMPSFLLDTNYGMPGDSCHAWYFDNTVPAWYEHHDFWAHPEAVGMPMIRVSGFTNSPECNFAPCDTALTTLAGSGVAYYFKQPTWDQFVDMRFELPANYGGRLEKFRMTFYSAGSHGTPDVDYYVWLSDGIYPLDNNPPYGAVAHVHVPYADIQWYSHYDTLDVYSYDLIFDPGESFHIGWTHAFDPNDTLAFLGDTSSAGGHRSSSWNGTAWVDHFNYRFKIDAYVCPIMPAESTFTMKCTPTSNSCNPGAASLNLYTVKLTPIKGYSLPVTFSLTNVQPPAAITAAFSPGSGSPPCSSIVAITVGPNVTYGDYHLTFQGVGSDGQTKTADVVLTAWDEEMIAFANGKQRVSDFGAVANGDAKNENFDWYAEKPLYDGGLIVATDTSHMALDVYDCKHHGWAPPVVGGLQEHMTVTYDPVYNVNMAAGHYCCDEALTGFPGVPGECDSIFFIGIMAPPVDFSVKIKVYYNNGTSPITNMYAGVFEDWDVGGATDWGDMDTLHNLIWQYNSTADSLVFGLMNAPFYDQPMQSIVGVHNPSLVYPNAGFCAGWGLDSLFYYMSTHQYLNYGHWLPTPDDQSMLMTAQPFSLGVGDKHIEIWINFGRNLNDGLSWRQWYHKVLRYVGFYRGDVNASDSLEVPSLDVTDLVYLINYLYKHGTAPMPYADQGDVNGDGRVDVLDVVYLINYVFINGPAPRDYVRFIPQRWERSSLFDNPTWH